ncbi:MAG: arginine deiminase family protein [Actinomycetota bacterium]
MEQRTTAPPAGDLAEPSAGYGVDSMAGTLRRVAMRRPGAILTADHHRWHYAKPVDATALTAQFQAFVDLVGGDGAEVVWLPHDADDDLADSVFTYDPSFVVPGGAIVMRPGKPLRSGEAALHDAFYAEAGIPVLGRIESPGLIEGGDCFFLDAATIAVGRGFRTNRAGIEQLRAIVEPTGISVEAFDLPYHNGPEACLHLLSVISPLDTDLALVHAPLLPTPLWERLVELGWELLVAPAEEFEASSGLNLNVLATAPRRVIAIDGFPGTRALMVDAGCRVETFDASDLCLPCEGGPTCLTRPLQRDPTGR